jgi:hypothetical protein
LADIDVAKTITITGDKSITLDLNGHKLTETAGMDGDDPLVVGEELKDNSNTIVTLTDSQSAAATGSIELINGGVRLWENTQVTLENITINYNGDVTAAKAAVKSRGTVTVKAGTVVNVVSDDDSGILIMGRASMDVIGKLTVEEGATIRAKGNAICNNGTASNWSTEITINGGTIEGNGTNGVGIYHAGNGVLTINGGKISGNTGVEIRAGKLIVNDTNKPTITGGDNGAADSTANGNGSTTVNAALAIAQHTTDNSIDVTINGGTFSGSAAVYQTNPQSKNPVAVTIAITGGDFTGTIYSQNCTGFITGGEFKKNLSEASTVAYVAKGYSCVLSTSGYYTVKQGVAQASVGDFRFMTLADAVAFATMYTNSTIKLIADADISGNAAAVTIPAGKSVTLDLNGQTLTAANTATGHIVVNGTLTLQDSTADETTGVGKGEITTVSDYVRNVSGYGVIQVSNGGTFIMNSGYINTVRENATSKGQFAITVLGNSANTVTINNGKIEAGWYAITGNGTYQKGASQININGGQLISTADYALYLPHAGTTTISGGTIEGAAGAIAQRSGTLIIQNTVDKAGNVTETPTIISTDTGNTGTGNDGTTGMGNAAINIGDDNRSLYGDCSLTITGGDFTANGNAITVATRPSETHATSISVTGGTFSDTEVKGHLTRAYVLEQSQNDDGKTIYTVTKLPVAATVEGTDYWYVQDAIDAANGKTVTLEQSMTESVTIPAGKTVTLDLNGKTLANSKADTITVEAGGTLTISGGYVVNNGDGASLVNNGTTNITDGTYGRVKNIGGELTIEDGTFTEVTADSDNPGTVAISGGTYSVEPNSTLMALYHETEANSDSDTYSVKEFFAVEVKNAKGTETVGEYHTISDALANVGNNQKIVLTRDWTESIEVNVTNTKVKKFTIDLGGNTLTNKEGKNTITITADNVSTVTITGGTVFNNTEDKAALENHGTTILDEITVTGGLNTIVNGASGDLTIENGIFENKSKTGAVVYNTNTATIEDGSFVGTNNGIVNAGVNDDDAIGELTINGGDVTAKIAVLDESSENSLAAVEITGGTFTGSEVSVSERADYIEISGGTFSDNVKDYVKDEELATNDNDDGTYTVGERIVAKVGDTKYTSLAAAFKAANGETVYLMSDETLASTVSYTGTLDLNGRILTVPEDGTAVNGTLTITAETTRVGMVKGGVFSVTAGSSLSLTGGVYTQAANKTYIAKGYVDTANGDEGTYTVSVKGLEAEDVITDDNGVVTATITGSLKAENHDESATVDTETGNVTFVVKTDSGKDEDTDKTPVTASNVTITAATAETIKEKEVTVETDVATVTMKSEVMQQVANDGGNVTLQVSKTENATSDGSASDKDKTTTISVNLVNENNETVQTEDGNACTVEVTTTYTSASEEKVEKVFVYKLDDNGNPVGEAIAVDVDENGNIKFTAELGTQYGVYETELNSAVVKQEHVDADNDDLCDDHGEIMGTYLKGRSLSLEGDVGENFYYYIPQTILEDVKAGGKFYAEFVVDGVTSKADLDPSKYTTDDEQVYYRFTCYVSAKQMSQEVSVTLHWVKADGKRVDSQYTDTYSVVQYSKNMAGERIKALMSAMLTYGAAAQIYFDYYTENLANADLSVSLDDVTAETLDGYASSRSGTLTDTGLTYKGATLILESQTSIRLYFTVDEEHSIDEYTFTDGDGNRLTVKQRSDWGSNWYYVVFDNIAAKELDVMKTAKVTVNGADEEAFTISYGALTYARNVLYKSTSSSELIRLAKALYKYNAAAKTYFAKQGSN